MKKSQLCRCSGKNRHNSQQRHIPPVVIRILPALQCGVNCSIMLTESSVLVVAILVIFVRNAHSTIWIKNIRSQGPAAAIAGTKCLAKFTEYYFHEPTLPRTKSMVISYTHSISSPAKEIQQQYLKWLHHNTGSGNIERCVPSSTIRILQSNSSHTCIFHIHQRSITVDFGLSSNQPYYKHQSECYL